MGLKLDKAKKAYQESKRGGEFWVPDEGETKLYLHPPCRDDDNWEPTDGLNYLPIGMHYSLGDDKKGACICLDAARNKILKHPFFQEEYTKVKGGKLDIEQVCPVCQAIFEGRMPIPEGEKTNPSRYQLRYLWGITPVDYARRIGGVATSMSPVPAPYMTGQTIYDGIMKIIVEVGDITDMNAAVYVKIVRTGQGLGTKYQVSADIESVRSPAHLDKAFKRAVLDAIQPGGECDLWHIAASLMKTQGEIAALISGVRIAEDEESPEGPAHPACFGRDYSEDEECSACGLAAECAAKVVEKEEAEKPKPAPAPRPAPKPAPAARPVSRPLPPVEPASKPAPAPKAAPKAAPKPAPKPEPEPEPEAEEEPLPDDEAAAALEEEAPEEVAEEANEEEAPPESDSEADLDKLEEQLERMAKPKTTKAPAPAVRTKTPVKR